MKLKNGKSLVLGLILMLAKAAVVAALLSTPSTLGADQGIGGGAMPSLCKQNLLNQCSLQIWTKNSFPRPGSTQSVTFSNGETLTCTSTGANKPRDCQLIPKKSSGDTQAKGLPQQCADLKQQLRDLTMAERIPQTMVGAERDELDRALQWSPGVLEDQIQNLESLVKNPVNRPDAVARRDDYTATQELNFLLDLRANQALGPGLGATAEQMQAKVKRILSEQQAWADDQAREFDHEIKQVEDQMTHLNCNSVPSVDQSVPSKP